MDPSNVKQCYEYMLAKIWEHDNSDKNLIYKYMQEYGRTNNEKNQASCRCMDIFIDVYKLIISEAPEALLPHLARIFIMQVLCYAQSIEIKAERSIVTHALIIGLAKINPVILTEYTPDKIIDYRDILIPPELESRRAYWREPFYIQLLTIEMSNIMMTSNLFGYSKDTDAYIYHEILIGEPCFIDILLNDIKNYKNPAAVSDKFILDMRSVLNKTLTQGIVTMCSSNTHRIRTSALTIYFGYCGTDEKETEICLNRLEMRFLIDMIELEQAYYLAGTTSDQIRKMAIFQVYLTKITNILACYNIIAMNNQMFAETITKYVNFSMDYILSMNIAVMLTRRKAMKNAMLALFQCLRSIGPSVDVNEYGDILSLYNPKNEQRVYSTHKRIVLDQHSAGESTDMRRRMFSDVGSAIMLP
jgi:hypothetical protein